MGVTSKLHYKLAPREVENELIPESPKSKDFSKEFSLAVSVAASGLLVSLITVLFASRENSGPFAASEVACFDFVDFVFTTVGAFDAIIPTD